ncbi:hypothetical protein GCM10008917_26340 [Paraclostridium tenue]|uniref:Uncharacterized protein n=1 Tax=Paraclostridium tenue TaxID=1737 RepID=A0ABP3XQ05_9FIRM
MIKKYISAPISLENDLNFSFMIVIGWFKLVFLFLIFLPLDTYSIIDNIQTLNINVLLLNIFY